MNTAEELSMIQALKDFAVGMGVIFPVAALIATFDFWFPFVKSLGGWL